MEYPGQTIENPVSGERITFRRTAAETNGELLAFDLELSRGRRRVRASTCTPRRRSASRWCPEG